MTPRVTKTKTFIYFSVHTLCPKTPTEHVYVIMVYGLYSGSRTSYESSVLNVHVTHPNRFGPILQSRVRCYAHVSIPPHLSCHDCPTWRHRGLADSGCRIIINRTWSHCRLCSRSVFRRGLSTKHRRLCSRSVFRRGLSTKHRRLCSRSVFRRGLSTKHRRLCSRSVFGSICPSNTCEREQLKVEFYSHERVSCWLSRNHLCVCILSFPCHDFYVLPQKRTEGRTARDGTAVHSCVQ